MKPNAAKTGESGEEPAISCALQAEAFGPVLIPGPIAPPTASILEEATAEVCSLVYIFPVCFTATCYDISSGIYANESFKSHKAEWGEWI